MCTFFQNCFRIKFSTNPLKTCLQWFIALLIFDLNLTLVSMSEIPLQKLNKINLQLCSQTNDLSAKGFTSSNGRYSIKIPANLTSRGDNDMIFGINNKHPNLPCDLDRTVLKAINWSDGKMPSSPNAPKRTLTDVRNASLSLLPVHFTSDGHFYDGEFYYQRSDYCIQSVLDNKINIRVCPIDCNSPSSICIPKCCGVDEVLLYWKKECKKLIESDNEDENEPQWRPVIFTDTKKTTLQYQYEPTGNAGSKRVYFQRQSLSEKCGENDFIEPLTLTTVLHPIQSHIKAGDDAVRLIADTKGNVHIKSYYMSKRKWVQENQGYCVDGYFVKGPKEQATYRANPEHQVILQCKPKGSQEESTNSEMRSWAYGIVGIFSSFFLLVTVIVYLILLEKQNTHGLTRLSYTGSMLASFVLASTGHFISLFPHGTGVFDRGWFCVTIGVSLHYFFLANYIWLTVMNFDLWITFRTMAVRDKFKTGLRFAYYSLVGWGLPLCLIIAFFTVDEVYRDPFEEVVVPDYGRPTCFVSPEFRGEYVYMPMGIVLMINIVLIFFTLKIFYDARQQSSRIFNSSKSAVNYNRYSAKLFAKLFVVMGGTSIVDFLTWYYNNDSGKPWIVVILECITYLVPVVLFCLFCLNKQTFAQFQEKFPGLKSTRFSSVVNRLGWFVEKKEQQSQQTTSTDDERINLNQKGTNVYSAP